MNNKIERSSSHIIARRVNFNQDIAYIIDNAGIKYGFAAEVIRIITYLAYAEYIGAYPVVDFRQDWTYRENKMISGTSNPWEYYFEQPMDKSLNDIADAPRIYGEYPQNLFGEILLCDGIYYPYAINEKFDLRASKIYKKYIKIRSNIQSFIEETISSFGINRKTLGVHVRRKVFLNGIKKHPHVADLGDYFKAIDTAFETRDINKIFLATVESDTVIRFKNRYGDKCVVFDDVLRSEDGEVQIMHSERENHNYLLGIEVLRDIYTLSRCGGLVAGMSNVSRLAEIINISEGKKYVFKKVFDLGIYKEGISLTEYRDKIKKQCEERP